MANAEFLIMGGTHGNERDGIELVASLQRDPIPNVDTLVTNEKAAKQGKRFIDVEFSTAAPGSNTYEGRRLAQVLRIGKPYKLILDFHNAFSPETYEIGMHPPTNPKLKGAVRWLLASASISHAISYKGMATLYDTLQQTVAIELGTLTQRSRRQARLAQWRETIGAMARIGFDNLASAPTPSLGKVMCLQACKEVNREEAKRTGVDRFSNLRRYDALPAAAVKALDLPGGQKYHVLHSGYRNLSDPIPGTNERAWWGLVAREIPSFL